ncbi:pilus assembly protein TadG-related protein [Ramlibacter sp. 2FC]|uniref:pilus assembly protein TadG-related protein n=1 Tax=Ramlibacter sp. 2FC TaxID=2502188 RepID=UPI00201DBF4A|nr:pilus assembly protein TadG-related protein [Ramlibacter sp. 2FC]
MAIVLGLSIFVLFGFLALVVDLGRTYVVRTELQNAADAAALAGAKQLNQTAAGVTSAVSFAIAMAAQNDFKFSTPVTITIADISVGHCPDDVCMVAASTVDTDGEASNKTFIKVDIPSGNLPTFFAMIPTASGDTGTAATTTYGRAVAGRFINDITPIGICAISTAKGELIGPTFPDGSRELAQFGFRRGVSYDLFNLGPLGSPADTYLLDPVDIHPNPCDPANSSANITAPFVCGGSSAILTTTPGTVWGNTGYSWGKIQAALNSRFNVYGGASVCIPAQAPPDINIQNFACKEGDLCPSPPLPAADWMTPASAPATQHIINPSLPPAVPLPEQYGVLWSYSRAVRGVVDPDDTTSFIPGTSYATGDWATLYSTPGGAPATNANFPVPATGSPYQDPSHTTAPTGNPGLANRRVLNLAIANCPLITGTGACMAIPVLGIGKFFMQVPAVNSPKKLYVEFAGLIDPVPVADIKLYR